MGNSSFTAREVEVLRISSDGDLFFGLKFSIPGFFWVGKFGKYFLGAAVLIFNTLYCICFTKPGNKVRKFGMGIFGG